MEKCSFAPSRCVTYADSLKNFDNQQLLADRLKGLRATLRETANDICEARDRHDLLKAYCEALGAQAMTTCAIHDNPLDIPTDQGPLKQLYRYHQEGIVAPQEAKPSSPESPIEKTTELEPEELQALAQLDIAMYVSEVPIIDPPKKQKLQVA